jgi:hypothetical protein
MSTIRRIRMELRKGFDSIVVLCCVFVVDVSSSILLMENALDQVHKTKEEKD